MPRIHVTASAIVDAPPARVYGILADYRAGHPGILPTRYFRDLQVEEGGTGEGTVIRFQLILPGSVQKVKARISEPDPGRVLAETDLATGAVTSFTVAPVGGGAQSDVRIGTEWVRPGLRGWAESIFAPPLLRSIYQEELANLQAAARSAG